MRTLVMLPLLWVLWGGASSAEEWRPHWNVISGDRQTVSSTCIGSNSTPQCLVDSAMACGAWSIPIGFSADGSYHDDAICLTTTGIERSAAPLSVFAPPALMEHHYLVDFWELTDKEMIDGPIMQYPEPWKAGDIIADLYTVSCAPEKSCMTKVASGDAADILASCPKTHCSGTPSIYHDMDGDGSLLFQPWTTLILRQGPEGWRVITTYVFANAQMHNDTAWVPNRWRRQE